MREETERPSDAFFAGNRMDWTSDDVEAAPINKIIVATTATHRMFKDDPILFVCPFAISVTAYNGESQAKERESRQGSQ